MDGEFCIENALGQNKNPLDLEVFDMLRERGMPVTEFAFARTAEETVQAAKEFGWPVVCKVVSRDILHKTEVGGVKLDLESERAVREAFSDLTQGIGGRVPQAEVLGVAVYPQSPDGVEMIVGLLHDEQFGAAVMVGMGGVLVEVMDDVAFRVAPVSVDVAMEMLQDLKGFRLLMGTRSQEPADVGALVELIAEVSCLGKDDRIGELDLNPVMVYADGVCIVDARMIWTEEAKENLGAATDQVGSG